MHGGLRWRKGDGRTVRSWAQAGAKPAMHDGVVTSGGDVEGALKEVERKEQGGEGITCGQGKTCSGRTEKSYFGQKSDTRRAVGGGRQRIRQRIGQRIGQRTQSALSPLHPPWRRGTQGVIVIRSRRRPSRRPLTGAIAATWRFARQTRT